MKIAVLASERGEKALHIYNFFKEGNRVQVDCLITDREQSPAADAMRQAGVETFTFPYGEWNGSGQSIADFLKKRGVEIVVVDDLESPVPPRVKEEFGEALLTPSGVTEAPGEVVSLYNHLKYAPTATKKKEKKSGPSTPEEEWAEVLKIEFDAEEAAARAVPPPVDSPEPQAPEPLEHDGPQAADAAEEPRRPQASQATQPPQPWSQTPSAYYRQGPPQDAFRPAPPQGSEPEPMPDTYLIWAVLATVLCCMIPGIVAIVFSSSVSSRYYAGDIEGAKRASKRAQIWIIVSVVTGIIWASLYLPLMLLGA